MYRALVMAMVFLMGISGAKVVVIEVIEVFLQPTVVMIGSSERTSSKTTDSTELSTTSSYSTGDIPEYQGKYLLNTTFASIVLSKHNQLRNLHHSQPLSWNNTLFEYAAAYASQYDCSGTLRHSGGPYGKNLALGYSPIGALNAWYKEGDTYNYQTHNEYNHFTALVWNSTSQLGCASRYCNSVWGDYIICLYYRAGNIVGYSAENVFSI